jgi:hypothetical protein
MAFGLRQYAFHLAYGVGLLLLPIMHARACAESTQPSASAVQTASATSPDDATQQPTDKETRNRKPKKPLSLAEMVPDVVAPRWPVHVPLAAERREQPLPVAAWRPFSPNGDEGGADQGARPAYLAFIQPRSPTVTTSFAAWVADERVAGSARRSLLNSITITGPPIG